MRNLLIAALLAGASLGASAAPQESQDPTQFQGEYDLQDGGRLSVNQRHHKLYARLDDGTAALLIATGPATFTDPAGQLRVEFIQSANGSVSGVRLTRQQKLAKKL
jgi:hypothetical protein